MSMLAMATPSPYPAFKNELPWDTTRASSSSFIPRSEGKTVALPSIRQTFPDLHLDCSLADVAANRHSVHKPFSQNTTSPEYVHSPNPNKKRRISNEDEQESLRAKQVPRLYRSPERPQTRQLSPHREHHASGSRTNGLVSHSSAAHPVEMTSRIEPRPALPSLTPTLKFEREPVSIPRHHDQAVEQAQPSTGQPMTPTTERSAYQGQDYGYSYQHSSHIPSLSTSSVRSYDRTPFSAGVGYGPHYQDVGRYSDLGGIGGGGDSKQRKRRGNLPKETTDKLRAWFVAHLQHPYPTEDEKQDLMRQTGLQMNQISNWFINARRRQLPAMINNARAESDATNGGRASGGSADGSILTSTEHAADYPSGKRDTSLHLSDSEGGAYDEDMGSLRQRRTGRLERESI